MDLKMLSFAAAFAVLGGAALAAPPTIPRDVQFTIPPAFRGEWNVNRKHCGTGLNDSRLRLSASSVRFYESGGPVKAVVRRGRSEIMLVAELSGEGETWLAAHRLILSADGSRLTAPSDVGGGLVRYRCPSN